MAELIKYELYKLIHDLFLKIGILLTLVITIGMLSGTKLSLNQFLQRGYIISVLASLYAVLYASYDFENRKIMYAILSGKSRSKIIAAKIFPVFVGTEIINLIFPAAAILLKEQWQLSIIIRILIGYSALGTVLAMLGIMLSWIFKRTGTAVLATIIFHLCSLFLMNGSGTAQLTMRILPLGAVKVWIEGSMQMSSIIMLFAGWFLISCLSAVIIAEQSEI